MEGIGGQNVRGKKTFGLFVPDSDDEDRDEVRWCSYNRKVMLMHQIKLL